MDYKDFKDYSVTLHDGYRHAKTKIVKRCASKVAAVRLADAIEKIDYPHRQGLDKWRATMAYPLNEKGQPVWD